MNENLSLLKSAIIYAIPNLKHKVNLDLVEDVRAAFLDICLWDYKERRGALPSQMRYENIAKHVLSERLLRLEKGDYDIPEFSIKNIWSEEHISIFISENSGYKA